MNGVSLITVKSWNTTNLDRNGLAPLLLKVVAGQMPNRAIISGTIAQNEGFEPNKTYLCQYTEGEPSAEHGRQFRFTNLGEVSGLDVIKATKELGAAQVVDVTNVTTGEVAEEAPAEEGDMA